LRRAGAQRRRQPATAAAGTGPGLRAVPAGRDRPGRTRARHRQDRGGAVSRAFRPGRHDAAGLGAVAPASPQRVTSGLAGPAGGTDHRPGTGPSRPGGGNAMFDRISRSWSLVKASAAVLRSDKELLLFPVISAIATVLVAATFMLPLFGLGLLDGREPGPGLYLLGFLFYLCQYFVIFFFNTALVGAAMIRLEGGDPTVSDGLRIARERMGAILGYAAIAATVGLVLRA